ncbi:hypothetical protein [Methylobacterium trifolii]|nr:hypothetical protein [Methylobacterium trifolii]
MAHYVRLRARPPRPANDNRSAAREHFWHWALIIGAMPTIGLVMALSSLL